MNKPKGLNATRVIDRKHGISIGFMGKQNVKACMGYKYRQLHSHR